MSFIKIAAVSYLNTFPFVHGIINSGYLNDCILDLDVPSVCAEKLRKGEVDIALVPVGAIPDFADSQIITNYCIGAVNSVKTVVLLSQEPLHEIKRIYLDFDSRSSVQLVKVLAREHWKIQPEWLPLQSNQMVSLRNHEAVVAIGDKTFEMVKHFRYMYDLAEEWIRFTRLPFVFAAWMSVKPIPPAFVESLDKALEWGVQRKAEALQFFGEKLPACDDCLGYLENNISYDFDDAKKAGLNRFLGFLKENGD
jgi:chorismate dehydratase